MGMMSKIWTNIYGEVNGVAAIYPNPIVSI